jgi:hypothetical protein
MVLEPRPVATITTEKNQKHICDYWKSFGRNEHFECPTKSLGHTDFISFHLRDVLLLYKAFHLFFCFLRLSKF